MQLMFASVFEDLNAVIVGIGDVDVDCRVPMAMPLGSQNWPGAEPASPQFSSNRLWSSKICTLSNSASTT